MRVRSGGDRIEQMNQTIFRSHIREIGTKRSQLTEQRFRGGINSLSDDRNT